MAELAMYPKDSHSVISVLKSNTPTVIKDALSVIMVCFCFHHLLSSENQALFLQLDQCIFSDLCSKTTVKTAIEIEQGVHKL